MCVKLKPIKRVYTYKILDADGNVIACGGVSKKRYAIQTFKDMRPDGNKLIISYKTLFNEYEIRYNKWDV